MKTRTKRSTRQAIGSLIALLFIAIIVPLGFGVAGAINDSATAISVYKLDTAAEFGDGDMRPSLEYTFSSAGYVHMKSDSQYDKQDLTASVWSADELSTKYDQVVVTAPNSTQSSTRFTCLWIALNLTVDDLIDMKVSSISLSLMASTAKTLKWVSEGTYTAYADGTYYPAEHLEGVRFLGWESTSDIMVTPITTEVAVANDTWGTYSTGWTMNVSATEWHTYEFSLDEMSKFRASTDITLDYESLCLVISGSGNTDGTSIIPGDSYKFKVELYGEAVSAVGVSEYLVGGLGIMLIFGSVAISPLWNPGEPGGMKRLRNPMSRSGRARRRSNRAYRRGSRRNYGRRRGRRYGRRYR